MSCSEAKRKIMEGAIKVNGKKINFDDELQIKTGDLIKVGNREHVVN